MCACILNNKNNFHMLEHFWNRGIHYILEIWLNSLAQSLVAANAGIIIFFSGIVTPIVFKTLSQQHAGKYLRAFFPRLYITLFATTIVAALVTYDQSSKFVLIIVAALFLLSLWPITPAINKATDSSESIKFKFLHTLSVVILMGQLVAFISLLFKWWLWHEPRWNYWEI